MKSRNITIYAELYKYHITSGDVIIKTPKGNKVVVSPEKLLGVSQKTWENAVDKRYGTITPKNIRRYVLRNLWDK